MTKVIDASLEHGHKKLVHGILQPVGWAGLGIAGYLVTRHGSSGGRKKLPQQLLKEQATLAQVDQASAEMTAQSPLTIAIALKNAHLVDKDPELVEIYDIMRTKSATALRDGKPNSAKLDYWGATAGKIRRRNSRSSNTPVIKGMKSSTTKST